MTREVKVITMITLFSTFLMGCIDAYTFLTHDGLFASAQTGNLVVLGAKILAGDFSEVFIHVSSFAGFAIGAFLAQGIVEHYKHYGERKYRKYLFFQIIFLLSAAAIQQYIGASLIAGLLGLLAGYNLTVFRKVKSTSMNNGIMTGNTKNMMNNLYLALFQKDRGALDIFLTLLAGLFVFMFGVVIGASIVLFNEALVLWFTFIATAICYLWLRFKKGF